MPPLRRGDQRLGVVSNVNPDTGQATIAHEDGSRTTGFYSPNRRDYPYPLTPAAAIPIGDGLHWITGSRCNVHEQFREDFNRVPNTGLIQQYRVFDLPWQVETAAAVGTNCLPNVISGGAYSGSVELLTPAGAGNFAALNKEANILAPFDDEFTLETEALYFATRIKLGQLMTGDRQVGFGVGPGGNSTGSTTGFFSGPFTSGHAFWEVADGFNGFVLTNHPTSDTFDDWQVFETVRVGNDFAASWIGGQGPYYSPSHNFGFDTAYSIAYLVGNGANDGIGAQTILYIDYAHLARLTAVADAAFVREIADPNIEAAA